MPELYPDDEDTLPPGDNGVHKTEEQRRLDNLERNYSALRKDMRDMKDEFKAIPLGLGTLRGAVDSAVRQLETRGWPRWAVVATVLCVATVAGCVLYTTWKAGLGG